ncbi:hypothetical protein VB780_10940 [Leptolyngbya sp. CCNP1308]|uniref:hypothetical protein n=1 Tax=Leptolyngbya sp. CCNP1308 TaxID=3110255 RepID=UPI002B200BC1|nr:hypothetical protein [Leptolyngbya sp. CCNP1308]MEA5449087.1 hypothetical protein [Leptolyngbya sp. CCNP1308]
MAPKKLTEADKTSILSLYRQPQETTSTLAERYGVSNSTISRLLKSSLPKDEYSVLIQQKRGADRAIATAEAEAEPAVAVAIEAEPAAAAKAESAAKPKTKPRRKQAPEVLPEVAPIEPADLPVMTAEPTVTEAPSSAAKPTRKRRSRSAAEDPVAEMVEAPPAIAADIAEAAADPEPTQLSLPDPAPEKPARPVLKSAQTVSAEPSAKHLDLTAAPDDAATLDDDDYDDDTVGLDDDDYDDDEDGDGDGEDGDNVYSWDGGGAATTNLEALEIFPLTAAALPPLCYVVVERTSSELVVLPLRTFAELGQIPEEEGDSRTLPVFENHNVARRFSRRNQRVVKVPDGSLLQTTSSYLQAKGITRLFIDGQVFSLGQDPVVPVGDD